jgi:hypothetical protein
MWEPRRLTILWASTACYRGNFTLPFPELSTTYKSQRRWRLCTYWCSVPSRPHQLRPLIRHSEARHRHAIRGTKRDGINCSNGAHSRHFLTTKYYHYHYYCQQNALSSGTERHLIIWKSIDVSEERVTSISGFRKMNEARNQHEGGNR